MFATPALVVASLLFAQPAANKPEPFGVKDGDRIVWIGNALVEREQRYGYWESALHAAFPDKQFTLRNLGWSGDTVFGDARASFDAPAKGFERLVGMTLELKPTVIFVSYGANESFEGEPGLPKFAQGLDKLLDALKPANARVVLFSPTPVEANPALVDPSRRNEMLGRYGEVVRTAAAKRDLGFADPFLTCRSALPMTENGIHFSPAGYEATAPAFLRSLGVDFPAAARPQLESLRQAIVAKNQLFFYKWRPQNETYLFGFRKHEQGNNAKDVVAFDPLIAKAEEEIETLRKGLK